MQHPRGHVPRRADIPFHVRIKREQLTTRIERDIERVAQTTGQQRDFGAIWLHAQDVAGGQLHVAVKHAAIPRIRDELIIRVVFQRRIRRDVLRDEHVVPMRHIDVAIRAEFDVIPPVPRAAAGAHELFLLLKHAIAIFVGQPHQSLRVVRIREERPVRIKQPTALQQLVIDRFHLLLAAAAEREAKQPLLFLPERDAPLRIKRHRHPRILSRLRRAHQLRLEARQQRQRARIRRLILRTRLRELPGVVSIEGLLQIERILRRIAVRGIKRLRVCPTRIRGNPAHSSEVSVEFETRGGVGFGRHVQAEQVHFSVRQKTREVRSRRIVGHSHHGDLLSIDQYFHRRIAGRQKHSFEQFAAVLDLLGVNDTLRRIIRPRQPHRRRRFVGHLCGGGGKEQEKSGEDAVHAL